MRRFMEVGRLSGPGFAAMRVGRGLATGDIDNDGDLDPLVTNNGQAAELLRNDGGIRGMRLSSAARRGRQHRRDWRADSADVRITDAYS